MFATYDSIATNDFGIELLESYIALTEEYNDILLESDLIDIMSDDYITESEEANEKKKKSILDHISNLIKAISTLFGKFFNMIANVVGGSAEDHLDFDAYIKSNPGKCRFNHDMVRIVDDAEAEVLKARKLVQTIAKGLNYDPREVANIVDSMSDVVRNNGKSILLTTAYMSNYLDKNKHLEANVKGALGEINDGIKSVTDPKRQADLNKLGHGIFAMTNEALSTFSKEFSVATDYISKSKNN